ncbi:hypothetical protein OG625_19940 [Streptomyces sp. NBC_01351]|uniref:hypothetical protein n=1 Tax=Streptomyces sp. NBC_01351 TaxID=2903833 RepID=UPI002E36AB65|nr:hypothetical protein [Streptomyces sp. NBC_01351]
MITPTGQTDGARTGEEAEDGAQTGTARPRPLAALVALGWSAATAAGLVAAGYAAYHWAATDLPLDPLPGSPWPYLAVWGVLCLVGGLLLRWATRFQGVEGSYAVFALALAGTRTSLAHRPDPALLWTYGALALALAAVGATVWRRRNRP